MRPYASRTDAELIRAARRDPDAFAALYDRYALRAVRWARLSGIPEPDLVDVVAESFARAWRARRSFRDPGDGSAAAWLQAIVRNLAAQHHRRGSIDDSARRRLGMTLDRADSSAERPEELSVLGNGPDLESALAALPPAQATAVRLRVIDDLDYGEIGHRLSCTPVAARKQVSLGLRRLRMALGKELR